MVRASAIPRIKNIWLPIVANSDLVVNDIGFFSTSGYLEFSVYGQAQARVRFIHFPNDVSAQDRTPYLDADAVATDATCVWQC